MKRGPMASCSRGHGFISAGRRYIDKKRIVQREAFLQNVKESNDRDGRASLNRLRTGSSSATGCQITIILYKRFAMGRASAIGERAAYRDTFKATN